MLLAATIAAVLFGRSVFEQERVHIKYMRLRAVPRHRAHYPRLKQYRVLETLQGTCSAPSVCPSLLLPDQGLRPATRNALGYEDNIVTICYKIRGPPPRHRSAAGRRIPPPETGITRLG